MVRRFKIHIDPEDAEDLEGAQAMALDVANQIYGEGIEILATMPNKGGRGWLFTMTRPGGEI